MKCFSKIICFFGIILLISLLLTRSYANKSYNISLKESTKESKQENTVKIKSLLNNFVALSRTKQFKKAHKLTTGKQEKIYASIINTLKSKNGTLPTDLENFLNRLKTFRIDIIEIDKPLAKAVAICTFGFKYFDTKSHDEIHKYREVLYYIKKEGLDWKIAYSKLHNENYYYKSKKNKNTFNKY